MATYALKGFSHFWFYVLKALVSDMSDQNNTVFKVALLKDTWTPDQDNDTVFSDISAHEITDDPTLDPDSDYPAGGLVAALLPAGASVSIVGRTTTFKTSNPTIPNATIGAYKLALYDATPVDPDDQVLCAYSIFGGLKASSSGTYTIQPNSSGWFSLAMPA